MESGNYNPLPPIGSLGPQGHTSSPAETSAAKLLSQICGKLDKTNELLELLLTAVEEKKKGGAEVTAAPVQQKFEHVQHRIFEDMKLHGGGTAGEIAKRMGLPESSVGPGLYRLWHKGQVSNERIPGPSGPISHYKIK